MATEKCPMSDEYKFYWEIDTNERKIPDVCQKVCSKLWETAIQAGAPDIDMFHNCASFNLSYEDTSLQGGPESAERSVSILTNCDDHYQNAFSESYTFICPNH